MRNVVIMWLCVS